jgi:acetyl-CoA synthetase
MYNGLTSVTILRRVYTLAVCQQVSNFSSKAGLTHLDVTDPNLHRESYPPPPITRRNQHIPHISSTGQYGVTHARSLRDPTSYWSKVASNSNFVWRKPWDIVLSGSLSECNIKWFEGAKLNITESVLDKHVTEGKGDEPAITWEGDDGTSQTFSFKQVLIEVSAVARVLQAHGVKKGDVISIYLPMIPMAAFTMLACARIGAVHSVVFAGFSADSVAERIVNGKSRMIITADAGLRAGKKVPLKAVTDVAIELAAKRGVIVEKVLVTHRVGDGTSSNTPGWISNRDFSLDDEIDAAKRLYNSSILPAVVMDANDPLFVLYTSGSTGKPKGVVHACGGWMVYVADTFKNVFDVGKHRKERDLHFSTADVGWVTGHSYNLYGPLINGTHTLFFEGTPLYPTPSRLWQVIEKHKATILYTAPTAIRSLMSHGHSLINGFDLSSLRLLGSVGEPINLEAWRWYYTHVGKSQLPIIDTYWQTETGGIVLSSFSGGTDMKPGKATKPYFGIDAKVVRESDGIECEDGEGGVLVFDAPWPGMARTVLGDHDRYKKTYFEVMQGRYFTGDGATRDKDGDIQISGRVDDVINVSGHRIGSAELESALSLHLSVAESACVGYPHPLKGEGLFCYITLKDGSLNKDKDEETGKERIAKEIIAKVRTAIGAIATPDVILIVKELPKTRSGKIMRRILKKIAAGEISGFGDLSTLADPEVVKNIVTARGVQIQARS